MSGDTRWEWIFFKDSERFQGPPKFGLRSKWHTSDIPVNRLEAGEPFVSTIGRISSRWKKQLLPCEVPGEHCGAGGGGVGMKVELGWSCARFFSPSRKDVKAPGERGKCPWDHRQPPDFNLSFPQVVGRFPITPAWLLPAREGMEVGGTHSPPSHQAGQPP